MSAPDKIWVNLDDNTDRCCPVETDLNDVGKFFNVGQAVEYTRSDLIQPASADYVAGLGLKRIVEEIDGAMNHGTWRDEHGMRLKDTPEWVEFYNSLAARPALPDTRVVTAERLTEWRFALVAIAGRDAIDHEIVTNLIGQINAIIGGQDRG